jgi:hypothetical protein
LIDLGRLLSGIESYCFFVSGRRRVEKSADERIYTWLPGQSRVEEAWKAGQLK